MFLGILHRMILIDLIKIFAMTLIAITGLILMAGVVSEAMRNGFGPMQIAACIPLLLPTTLPYTLPPTVLFATCIVYGRLSADNEILALKAAGVHIVHVIWPALLLGAVVSSITMLFFLDLIPSAGCMLRNMALGDVEELLYTLLRKDGHLRHPRINVEIDVKSVDGRKLRDAIFKRRSPDGKGFDIILVAKEAELRVDLAHQIIRVHMKQCQVIHSNGGGSGIAEDKIFPLEVPKEMFGSADKFRAMDMTWEELSEYEEKSLAEIDKLGKNIEMLQMQRKLGGGSPGLTDAMNSLAFAQRQHQFMLHSIQAERAMRPALALGALCFALVGCPVGIWFSKSDYLSAFITCFLPIVVIYYPLMFAMFDLARIGKFAWWMTIFNADALTLLIGAELFRRLARN